MLDICLNNLDFEICRRIDLARYLSSEFLSYAIVCKNMIIIETKNC